MTYTPVEEGSCVIEAFWNACYPDRHPAMYVLTFDEVVAALREYEIASTWSDARDLIFDTIEQGQLQFVKDPHRYGTKVMYGTPDPVRLDVQRRYWFVNEIGPSGIHVPAHINQEGVIARAGIIEWEDTMGEAAWMGDLVNTVHLMMGYDHPFWALHVVLNAIDVGAIYTEPEYPERTAQPPAYTHRCYLTDGWLQTQDA